MPPLKISRILTLFFIQQPNTSSTMWLKPHQTLNRVIHPRSLLDHPPCNSTFIRNCTEWFVLDPSLIIRHFNKWSFPDHRKSDWQRFLLSQPKNAKWFCLITSRLIEDFIEKTLNTGILKWIVGQVDDLGLRQTAECFYRYENIKRYWVGLCNDLLCHLF